MAVGDPYATLPDLKSRLDIEDQGDDDRLTDALASASREIELWCDRQFNKDTVASARVYEPDGPTLVLVDDFHTTTGLVIGVDMAGTGAYGSWSSSAYQLEPANGVVAGQPGWPYSRIRTRLNWTFPCSRWPSVQVTAQWGWAAVPDQVREACLIIAAESFKLGDAPFGVAGFGEFGPVRVRMNSRAQSLLAPYRRDPILVA